MSIAGVVETLALYIRKGWIKTPEECVRFLEKSFEKDSDKSTEAEGKVACISKAKRKAQR